jgi:hypothetical protein
MRRVPWAISIVSALMKSIPAVKELDKKVAWAEAWEVEWAVQE